MRVPAWKFGDAGEFVDLSRSVDLLGPAGAKNTSRQFEWMALPLVIQSATAATEPSEKFSVMVTEPEGDRPATLCAVGALNPEQPAIASADAARAAWVDQALQRNKAFIIVGGSFCSALVSFARSADYADLANSPCHHWNRSRRPPIAPAR